MLARFALPPATRTMHRQAGAVEPGISLPQAHYPNPHTARRSRRRIFTSLSWDFLYSWIRVPGLHLTRYGLQLATHQPCHGAAIPWMGGKEFRGSCCYALSWDASGHGHATLTLALLGAECGCGHGVQAGRGGWWQEAGPKPHTCTISHWTWLRKHKFKNMIIKCLKTATTEHSAPFGSARPFWMPGPIWASVTALVAHSWNPLSLENFSYLRK